MKKFILLFFSFTLISLYSIKGQSLSDYSFASSNETFSSISTTGTTVGCSTDDSQAQIAIPFAFSFGENFFASGTNISVCSNGYITLNTTYSSTIPPSTGNYCIISALGHDLNPETSGTVYYETSGTSPNQILTIEWNNISLYGGGNNYNFQIKLYESSNNIQLCYGNQTITTSSSSYIFLREYTENDIVAINGDWNTPFTTSSISSLNISTSSYPANGLTLTFSRPVISCPKPTNLTITNISPSSADISWTPGGSETSWELVYVISGEDLSNATPISWNSTSYSLTNLFPDTPYDIYVRANCGTEYSFYRSASLRTDCGVISHFPYQENFDSYGTGTTAYPTCWSRLNTYSSTRPYIYTSYYYSEPACLYFYASSNTYNIAILPRIDVSFPLNTLMVSFKMRAQSTTDKIEVGIMTDSADASTFQLIQSVSPSNVGVWEDFIVSLSSYTGTGHFLAFRNIYSNATAYAYLDDVLVEEIPACMYPTEISFSQLSESSLYVNWTAPSSQTNWEVVVVDRNANPSLNGTPEQVFSHPHFISGLTPDTDYDIYVRADCGTDGFSAWSSPLQIHTRCIPLQQIPYIENFDSSSTDNPAFSFPSCWTRICNNTSTNYPYITSNQHYNGAGSLYFYSNSTIYSYAIMQAMDAMNPINTLQLNFKALKTSESYGRLDVGVMSDPDDPNSFTLLKAFYATDYDNINIWTDFTVNFINYNGTGSYIALRTPIGTTNYLYIDSISVDIMPSCLPVQNLEVSNIVGASAYITWDFSDLGPANSYTVEYSETGLNLWTPISTSTNSCFITGLSPQTDYEVRVACDCDFGDLSTYVTSSFTTTCLTGGNLQIGEGTTTSYLLPINTFYNYTYSQQIFLANEMSGPGLITGIDFQYAYSASLTAKTNVTIYLAHTSQDYFNSSTNWIPITNADTVYSGTLNCSTGWNHFDFSTPFNYNGIDNLVLIIDDNSGSYNSSSYTFYNHTTNATRSLYYYSDGTNPNPASPPTGTLTSNRNNVIFSVPCDSSTSCIAPNIVINNYDAESISFSWAPGLNESTWDLDYKIASDSNWITLGPVYSTSYDLDNLLPETTYQIRMRAQCDAFTYSNYTTISITTPCVAITSLPFIENFDATGGSGSSFFMDCWTRTSNYTSSNYPYTYSLQSLSSPNSLYFYGTSTYYSYAVTPIFGDLIEMDSLQLIFSLFKTNSSYYLELGVMDDPSDLTSFTLIQTVTPSIINTWEEFEINLTNYNGTGKYIVFRIPSAITNYMFLDNLSIDYIPNCERVTDIIISNITANSATLSWTSDIDHYQWEYLIAPVGTIDLINDLPIITAYTSEALTNLLPNTLYDVYVRAMCTDGEYSTYRATTFRTACGDITSLPYTENFDSYGTGSTAYPTCWNKINTYSSERPYISTTYTSSPGGLYFYANSGTYNIAITPPISNTYSISDLMITFSYRNSYTTDMMIIGVMTDPTDVTTFTPIDTVFTSAISTWEVFSVGFNNYQDTGRYIAFKNICTSSASYAYGYIDDVVIDEIPSCPDVNNLTYTSIASTSVTLDWNSINIGLGYEISQGTGVNVFDPELGTITTLPIAANPPYIITGLQANTTYHFAVRQNCPGNWSNVITVTTLPLPATLPYLLDCEDTIETAAWRSTTNSINDWAVGSAAGNGTSITGNNAFYISNNGGASYQATSEVTYCNLYRDIDFGSSSASYLLSIDWQTAGFSEGTQIYSGVVVFLRDLDFPVDPEFPSDVNGNSRIALLYEGSTWGTTHISLENMSGVKRLFFFYWSYNSTHYSPLPAIDNIVIENSCANPENVTVSNITGTTAEVSWDLVVDATSYVISCQKVGGTQEFFYVSTSPKTITGLQGNTDYLVSVKSRCGSQSSAYTENVPFTTIQPDSFNITASSTGYGTITPSGTIAVQEGNNAPFVLSPDDGYTITQLLIDGVSKPIPASRIYTFYEVTDNHTIEVEFAVGIEETELSKSITLYPNPTNENIVLSVPEIIIGDKADLFDIYGKLIKTISIDNIETIIDLSELANGIYFIQIIDNNGIINKKIIKK